MNWNMGFYQLRRDLKINASIGEVWNFIADPSNLKKITPGYMGFDIMNEHLPDSIYEGMIIRYSVKPLLGISTTWVTEITHVREGSFFVDEQRVGPYTMWHHEHLIREEDGYVVMTDIVSYKPPLGFLGSLANSLFIRRKLDEIFDYRTTALLDCFKKRED